MSIEDGNFIYDNVEKTLEKIRSTINEDRNKTHGNPLLWARTFIDMLNAFIVARTEMGARLDPADAFTIMGMMKHARTAVAPIGALPFDTALDAAGYDVLRAAWLLPPDAPVPAAPTLDDLKTRATEAVEAFHAAVAAEGERQQQAADSAKFNQEFKETDDRERADMAGVLASEPYKSPVMDAIDAGTLGAQSMVLSGPSAPSLAALAAVVDRGGPGAEAPPTTPLPVDPVTLNRAPTPLPVIDDGSEHHPDPLWDAPSPVVEPEPVTDGKAGPKGRSKVS